MPRRSARWTPCARSIWCRSPNSSSPARPSAASAPAMSRRSAPPPNDPLYEAISEGRRHPGMEHWLPLFHRAARHAVRLSARQRGRASSRSPRMRRMSASPRSPTITTRGRRRSRPTAPARSTSRCGRSGSISARPNGSRGSRQAALARLTPFADPDARRASMPARGRGAISRPSAPRPRPTSSMR